MVQRRKIMTTLRWLVVGIIFYSIGHSLFVNWGNLAGTSLAFRPELIFASLFLLCLHFFFYAVLWHLLTMANHAAIGFRAAMTAWFYSMLGKYVPGKVVLWAGRIYYYNREGHSIKKASFCFSLELALQFLASLLIIGPALLQAAPPSFLPYRLPLLAAAAVVFIVVNPKSLAVLLNMIFKLLGKEPVALAMKNRQLYPLLAGYVLNGLLLGGAFFLFVNGFYPMAPERFLYLTGSFLLAGWAGILSLLAPGGLGVREGVLLVGLEMILPAAVAAMVVLAARLWATAGELLCALAVFIVNRWRASA